MNMSPGKSTDAIMKKVRDVANVNSDRFVYLRDLEAWQSEQDERIIILLTILLVLVTLLHVCGIYFKAGTIKTISTTSVS